MSKWLTNTGKHVMQEKKCILIVDDEEEITRAIIERILMQRSDVYDALVSTDGHEALDLMRTKNVDVVLLDIRLPNFDGTEVCRQITTDESLKSTPVIVTSGFLEEEGKNELRALGIKDFLDKPYTMDALFKRIDEVVGSLPQN